MQITVEKGSLTEVTSDIAVVSLFEDIKNLSGPTGVLDSFLDGLISDFVVDKEEFSGKFGKMYYLPTPQSDKFSKVLVVGLGKQEDFNLNKLREISAKVIQKCKSLNVKTITSAFYGVCSFDAYDCAQMISEGTIIGGYSFDKYKSKKEDDEKKIEKFSIVEVDEDNYQKAIRGLEKGKLYAGATNCARDLSNEPAMVATPSRLAEFAQSLDGIEVKVYEKSEIEELGMRAFLAVSQGSDQPPKFIHMKYYCENPRKKIAIIGKGVTFDSGGLDIKPPASMLNMKDDMSGAGAMLGIMSVIRELSPNIEIHALIASCENMVNGSSYKPGDILTAKNGKTIEIDNTDAEGRVTLADVLTYAEDLGVDEIIDMATLTGACLVALGSAACGIFGNNQNLIDNLKECGQKAGENLWQMPMYEEYKESLKSDIADMKNTGSRCGGSSVAAAFLENFILNKTPWAHLDIAGTAYLEKTNKMGIKAATGFGVRTLLNYIITI